MILRASSRIFELLSPEGKILAIQQFFLDHPENSNSLKNMLETGQVTVEGEIIALELDVLDSVMALMAQYDAEEGLEATSIAAQQSNFTTCHVWADMLSEGINNPASLKGEIEHAMKCMDEQRQAASSLRNTRIVQRVRSLLGIPASIPLAALLLSSNVRHGLFAAILPKGFVDDSLEFEIRKDVFPRSDNLDFLGVEVTKGIWSKVTIEVADGERFDLSQFVYRFLLGKAKPNPGEAEQGLISKFLINELIKRLATLLGRADGTLDVSAIQYSKYPQTVTGPRYSKPTGPFERISITSHDDSRGTFELTFEGGCGIEAFSIETVGSLLNYPSGRQGTEAARLNICPVKATRSPDLLKLSGTPSEVPIEGSITVKNEGHELRYVESGSDAWLTVEPQGGTIKKGESVTFKISANCEEGIDERTGAIGLKFTLPDGTDPSVAPFNTPPLAGFPPNVLPVKLSCNNASPVAALTVTPKSGKAPLTVTANASASTDDGKIVNYTFDFGDGKPLTGAHSSAQHVYEEPGFYTVSVTVTDDVGLTDSASETVEVWREYIGTFTFKLAANYLTEQEWEGYDCALNRISGTEVATSSDNREYSASVVFREFVYSDGTISLRALSLQGGDWSDNINSRHTYPTYQAQDSYSSGGRAVELSLDAITLYTDGRGSGGVDVAYQGTYESSYSSSSCNGPETKNDAGKRVTSVRFFVEGGSGSNGSYSGSHVKDYSFPRTCDNTSCKERTWIETYTWTLNRR